MSSNEFSSDLDSRIAAIVENTVGRMRDELMHRMQDTEERLRDITSRVGAESPVPVPAPAPEPVPETPAAAAGNEMADLFDGVTAIDRGGSQQEVLAAMLEAVGRFAGRAAIFLTRSEGAQGWGSYGFEESARDIQQVLLSYGEGPLATLAEGRGCVRLNAQECAALARQMEAAPGAEGLLVPFVLRDRLAAALYLDRFAGDPALARQPLQLLAYAAAQAVEGLALRQRSETPTLQVADEVDEAPGVALWEDPATAEPAVAPAPAEPVAEPEAVQPTAEPEAVAPEPDLAAPAPIDAPPEEITLEEMPAEEPPTPAPLEAPPSAATTDLEAEPGTDWGVAAPVEAEPSVESTFDTAETVVGPAPAAEAPESIPAPTVEEPQAWTESGGEEFAAVETTQPPPPETAPPAAPAETPPGGTTEVRPPTDVTGPGWAFTASRAAAEAGDDAQHEEARRLARLLVTEIKLYNEEQVEEGRRSNDIYARLKEDIDRSRQIFNERVDETVRQETDYFQEEMVRILAGGNAEALGV